MSGPVLDADRDSRCTCDGVDDAWRPIMDASTTLAELERIIDDETRIVLVDALAQLATDDLPLRDLAAAIHALAPVVRDRTRAALTAAWTHLQAESAASAIH